MKNKAPAPVQITAEQLLREAKERQLEIVPPVSFKQMYSSLQLLIHVLQCLFFNINEMLLTKTVNGMSINVMDNYLF